MKKLFNVIVLMLAINFIALAGSVGYLKQSGHLDRDRVMAIKDIVFPAPATQPTSPTTQPAPTTQPIVRLEELLAQQSGRTASEQVEFIQHTFDAQMAQIDRRQRELNDLQSQIDLAKAQLARDRSAVAQKEKTLTAREQEATKLESDKGFQDSLALYKSMPGKQVKSVFLTMDDRTVAQFLQAMEPRTAAKIIKEFKTPEETQFIQRALQKMRDPQPLASAGAGAGAGAGATTQASIKE
jgi:flagellar motility protein MotE (MotC chaperone)